MSDERAMMTKIERGERLESADEMSAVISSAWSPRTR